MQLETHLTFNGQCEEAFRFYEKCLGGKITMMMRNSDAPMPQPPSPEMRDKIIHATLTLDGRQLAGADMDPQQYRKPEGFSVILNLSDPAQAERVFAALAEKGSVRMPMQETFWALRYGSLTDRFGIPWEINCGKPA
ncbi:MAG TPA: VOC family protein [Urbifossiella sp.]|jgi:PhnB protein